MAPGLPPETPVVVTRRADLGRHSPPRLTVPLARLSAFTRVTDDWLEATCEGLEWQAGPERVVVDPRRNPTALYSALGRLAEAADPS